MEGKSSRISVAQKIRAELYPPNDKKIDDNHSLSYFREIHKIVSNTSAVSLKSFNITMENFHACGAMQLL